MMQAGVTVGEKQEKRGRLEEIIRIVRANTKRVLRSI
jgi:hypothetical protein